MSVRTDGPKFKTDGPKFNPQLKQVNCIVDATHTTDCSPVSSSITYKISHVITLKHLDEYNIGDFFSTF